MNINPIFRHGALFLVSCLVNACGGPLVAAVAPPTSQLACGPGQSAAPVARNGDGYLWTCRENCPNNGVHVLGQTFIGYAEPNHVERFEETVRCAQCPVGRHLSRYHWRAERRTQNGEVMVECESDDPEVAVQERDAAVAKGKNDQAVLDRYYQSAQGRNQCRGLCQGGHQDCEASCRHRFGDSQLNNPQCWMTCNAELRQCAAGCP